MIRNVNGEILYIREEIEGELCHFFQDIMKEPNRDRRRDINRIRQHIHSLVSRDHNNLLMKQVTLEEVEEGIKQMPEGKDSGPNGFIVSFFRQFWDMIKNELWKIWNTVGDHNIFSLILMLPSTP